MADSRVKTSEYKSNDYWWWRNPYTGNLLGPYKTRREAREARRLKQEAQKANKEEAA